MRRPPLRPLFISLIAMIAASALALTLVVWQPGGITFFGVGARCVFDAPSTALREVETLRRVASVGDGTTWAVGSRYLAAVGQPIALRWDGERWTKTPVPVESDVVTSGLHDVAATGSGEAFAVGSIRAETPYAIRWDGTDWKVLPTIGTGEGKAEWLGVAATRAGGTWAVGKKVVGGYYRTIVGRLEQGRLVAQDGPVAEGLSNVFIDVDLSGEDAGWAVGWTVGEDGLYRTLAARLAGGAWIVEPTPDPGEGDNIITTVAVVGLREAWAVGWSQPVGGEPVPLVLRWDGATWTSVRPPSASGRLLGVAALGGRTVVVGDVMDATRRARPLVAIYEDGTWGSVPVDVPENRWFTGVSIDAAGDVVAVGPSIGTDNRYGSFIATGC